MKISYRPYCFVIANIYQKIYINLSNICEFTKKPNFKYSLSLYCSLMKKQISIVIKSTNN